MFHLKKHGNKAKTARLFGICKDTVAEWGKRHESNNLAPHKSGPAIGSFKKVDPKEVCKYLDSNNDITLFELAEIFKVSSVAAIWKILSKSGYVNKKNTYVQRKGREATK